ncbi:MAG: hypothetical protein DHS20C16_05620 [Phycisphaerae bacterium]|nr:MAG: hypothetical protein DHS20C16_05620 [Phycisphaerae bacterium]
MARPRSLGRNIRLTAIFLVVSAIVFCLIVVRQRDMRSKDASLQWAKRVEASLQKILDERKFLPQRLPDGLDLDHGAAQVSYPQATQVSRLELSEQPFLVIAGPRKGLIMPGQDGCAGVMYDAGKVEAIWLSVAELEAARERRQKLMAGPTESG